MNLRDLEYAVCLAGEGQFRRAAARCHVSAYFAGRCQSKCMVLEIATPPASSASSPARADEFMMSFQRATTAWAWGDPTLDRKTRSLMNLALERDRWFPDSPLEEDGSEPSVPPQKTFPQVVFLLYQKGP